MLKYPTFVFISSHADGDDMLIACILKKGFGVMNGPIYSIAVDGFVVVIIIAFFQYGNAVGIQFCEFVFITLVFN